MTPFPTLQLRGRPLAGGRQPLLCVPLIAADTAALLDQAQRLLACKPDLVEWRVDHFAAIADAAAVLDAAAALRRGLGDIPLLFTRRSIREGGQPIALDEAGVVALTQAVIASGCIDCVDVELSCDPAHFRALRDQARGAGVLLIASFHDFQATPSQADIVARLTAAAAAGADVAKVAVMPQSPDDVLTLLAATLQASRQLQLPLITIAMGELGAMSRMFGWMFGSCLTFAVGTDASAPGQLPIDTLRAVLRSVQRGD